MNKFSLRWYSAKYNKFKNINAQKLYFLPFMLLLTNKHKKSKKISEIYFGKYTQFWKNLKK